MTNFRKLLAVIICMVLIVATLPMTMAFAQDGANCKLDTMYHVFVLNNEDVVTFNFTPQESGYYSLRSFGFEDAYVDVYDEYYNFVYGDDDGGKEYNFICNVYLEKDKTYYFEMSAYYAYESEFDFMLTKMSDLTIATIDEAKTETVNLDENNISAFFEFTAQEDGYYAFSSKAEDADTYLFAYDDEWNFVNKDDDGGADYNGCVNLYLKAGESCYLEATTYSDGDECTFDVVLNKTEVVTDIEVNQAPDTVVYFEGYVDEMIDFSGLKLKLTYSDGTTVDYNYDESPEIVGTSMYFDWDIDEDGNYFMCIMTDFAYVEMPIEVIENPVKSISVSDEVSVELLEHTGGFFEGENYYYTYDVPKDLIINVEYTDGTTATVDFASGIMGYDFISYDNQGDGEYFTLGNNTAYIEYFGVTCEINVFVTDLPSFLGDVDCDSEISIMDATAIQLHSAKKLELTDAQLKLADTDKDQAVSVMDATQIQRLLAKKIPQL